MLKKSILIFCLFLNLTFSNETTAESEINFNESSLFKNQDLEAFLAIPLTDDDKSVISEFIKYFASTNMVQLLENRKYLETFKNQVQSIHGLRLISFILTDPDTNRHMKSIILEADLKLAYTTIVLESELMDAVENGLSDQLLSGFADFSKLDKNIIRNYIHQENYRALVKYLVQI